MKFYKNTEDYIEIMSSEDPVLSDIIENYTYGYIDDFSDISNKAFLEFAKGEKIIIFTTGELFKDEVLFRHDRSCKTVKKFVATNTLPEQWAYYTQFIRNEPDRYQYKRNKKKTRYVLYFEETGEVVATFLNDTMVFEKNGEILDIIQMTFQEWEGYIEELMKHNQVIGE